MLLTVAVPANSQFFTILNKDNSKHIIKQFNPHRLKVFYTCLFVRLLFRRFSSIYINEAGHIKYIKFLSKIFKNISFIVHVRLVEDTNVRRWNNGRSKNLTVIAISKYIQNRLPVKSTLIYDPYNFRIVRFFNLKKLQPNKLRVGVIGRIAHTKGIEVLLELLNYINELKLNHQFNFYFFGQPSKDVIDNGLFDALNKFSNVHLRGFVLDKDEIYNDIDCVLHTSLTEPLGRIFFEAIDYYKPIIGFTSGGIGEIANILGLTEILVDENSSERYKIILKKLQVVRDNYYDLQRLIFSKKKTASEIFKMSTYTCSLDKLFIE